MTHRKMFPSKISWTKFWYHRHEILNMLNQIAHGSNVDAEYIAEYYGGSREVGLRWLKVAREIINVKTTTNYRKYKNDQKEI